MKDFLGLALAGVGIYVLYEWFNSAATVAQSSATPTTSTTSNTMLTSDNQNQGANSAGGNQQPVATVADLKSQLVAAALQNGQFNTTGKGNPPTPPPGNAQSNPAQWVAYLNALNVYANSQGSSGTPIGSYYQWNYIFTQVTGISQTAGPIGDPNATMDVNGYINMRGANGLSGLDTFGMGRVWASGYGGMGKIGRGYGINELAINSDATAYELASKVFH